MLIDKITEFKKALKALNTEGQTPAHYMEFLFRGTKLVQPADGLVWSDVLKVVEEVIND